MHTKRGEKAILKQDVLGRVTLGPEPRGGEVSGELSFLTHFPDEPIFAMIEFAADLPLTSQIELLTAWIHFSG
jgi:hypothetical protein